MGLLKLFSNRISREWKEKFNKNVDYLNNLEKKLSDQDKSTNSRIDNLVLHSGGESPNEVVDARVNNKGEVFDTLQGRLGAVEKNHEADIRSITAIQVDQNNQINQLNEVIRTLYNSDGESICIYVSADLGNDAIGDGSEEKPFKTIQTAINQIPFINSSSTTIFIDSGVYLEDVRISNVISPRIEIRSADNVSGNGDVSIGEIEAPVKVRSIWASNCSSVFRLYGIQFVDQINVPKIRYPFSIAITDAGSMVIEKCAFRENTKNIPEHRAIQTAGNVSLHVMKCDLANQNAPFYADTGSELRVGGNNTGTDNNVVAIAENSTIRTSSGVSGKTPTQTIGAGLIITKGTVM